MMAGLHTLHNSFQFKGRMLLFLQKWQYLILGYADGFIGNPVCKIFHTQAAALLIDFFTEFIFETLGHPDQPADTAFGFQKLL